MSIKLKFSFKYFIQNSLSLATAYVKIILLEGKKEVCQELTY